MLNRLLLVVFFVFGTYVYGQQSDCQVKVPRLAGTYTGGCKNGLAHGKGIAQGTDRYEGQFSKGIPDGRGTYTWANGTYYEGQWENGMREGKGKEVYMDSVITGYWKEDRYIGIKLIPPYTITRSTSVARSTFSKLSNPENGVKIKFLRGGNSNYTIEGFSMVYSSGEEYQSGVIYGIQNVRYPLDVKIMYRTWNLLGTASYDVVFEFTINDPGSWDVTISN